MSVRNLITVLATLTCTVPAFAQSPTADRFRSGSIGWDVMRPVLDDEEDINVLLGSVLYARVPVGRVHLVAELPFAVADDEFESSQALGNILVGAEAAVGKLTMYGGVRAPTAPDDEIATFVGFMSDYLRPEAWASSLWSVNGGARLHDRSASGVGYDFALGATMLVPDESDVDNDLLLDYRAQISYRPGAFGITGGVNGRAITTGEGSFSERTIQEAQVRLDYTKGRWRPALDLRMPIDEDLREAIKGVLRLGVEYAIH